MKIRLRFAATTLVVVPLCAVWFQTQIRAAGQSRAEELIAGRRAAAGQVLVHFRHRVYTATLADADIDRDQQLGPGNWRVIHSRSRSALALLAALRQRADVLEIEPDFRVAIQGAPDDLLPSLWGLDNTGQPDEDGRPGTPQADIGAVRAWNTTTGSRGVVVATLDTGIMATHEDLAANLWTAPRDFAVTISGRTITCAAGTHGFNAINGACVPDDDNGHGTHVAGIIGAVGGNGRGVVGVNWQTSIMALKFLDSTGSGYVSDAVEAIEFAIQAKQALADSGAANVRVLNASWSGGDYSQALADEIARAADNDILFVAAAGNTATDVDTHPAYPANYTGANIVSVASTDNRDELSSFSDYGAASIHIAAPGTSIYSTYMYPSDPGTSAYATLSGTSMAAAYVSGTAALVLSACAYPTGALRNALLASATSVPALGASVRSGRRLNAAAAVESCGGASPDVGDIILQAADVPQGSRHGQWTLSPDSTAAGGEKLSTPDEGWAATSVPLAAPSDYFDITFTAPAGVPYHVWLRMHASGESKWNDSVWLQFSDAEANGAAAFAINSTAGYAVNLENCSGCGVAGWGWQDGSYWLPRTNIVFSSSGTHTMRVQTREDGVEIDQIVLSPSTYLTEGPGAVENDTTILGSTTSPAGGASSEGGSSPPGSSPFGGAAVALPGTIDATRFDSGGEGVAYHDATPGNTGGAFRSTDVDLEPSSEGGFSVGWIDAGEWLRYSVNVSTAGEYLAAIRVASPSGGGSLRVVLDSGRAAQTSVPATGGWQTWTTVTVPLTLDAGAQTIRLMFDSAGFNVAAVAFAPAGGSGSGLAPFGGSARALPGVVAAADFDAGGEGIAYHDTTSGNTGGAYRSTDVDIAPSAEGGYTLGWIEPGEWANYTVNVATSGMYTVQIRVAAPDPGGRLHLGFNGASSVWQDLPVPQTGDWQQWTSMSVPVTLSAGVQQITLYFDTAGYNVSWLRVDPR
jgi:subtilisin family serine protease